MKLRYERLTAITKWLRSHHKDVASGIRSVTDAGKLYDYWQERRDVLPEFCDGDADGPSVDVRWHRITALGYNPLVIVLH